MKKLLIILHVIILASSCRESDEKKAYVAGFSGNVKVNGEAVKETGLSIKYNDIVETASDSYCDIIIDEKNILRITGNSRLVFRISGQENILQLDRGWMAAVAKRKFTRDGTFMIKTPTVTASVRGTSFCIKVENSSSTYFCVCNGSVTLAGTDGSSAETVTAAQHAGRRFSQDRGSGFLTIDRNPGLLYHDNSDIDRIAAIINERIDWSKPYNR